MKLEVQSLIRTLGKLNRWKGMDEMTAVEAKSGTGHLFI